MKNNNYYKSLLVSLLVFLGMIELHAQDPNFHIYLCFGQSNMEGSASIEPKDKLVNDRFLAMQTTDCNNLLRTQGIWYPAVPPLSQCYTGLSPADAFGKTMVKHLPDSIKVGVMNVAIGGSDIRLFDKEIYQNYLNTYPESWFQDKINGYGGNPYQRLIELAKKAQKNGVIKGILLHQGETNTGDKKWPLYVKKIYESMLSDLSLNADEVPLLAGEVVGADQGGKCAAMNPIIQTLPNVIPTAHVISSKGCTVRDDQVHFNSAGVRELGKRYAEQMLSIQGIAISKKEPNKPSNVQVSRIDEDSFTVTWDNDLLSEGTNIFIEDPEKKTGNVYVKTLGPNENSFSYKGNVTKNVTIDKEGVYVARFQSLPDTDGNAYTEAIVNMKDPDGEKIKFDPNFHIYLCIGQSNMEGSAAIQPQDLYANERLKVLQSLDCGKLGRNINRWYTAIPPLFHCSTGLSPADYFGRTLVEQLPEKIKVGLVPVAVGGCDIRIFDKDIYQDYNATTKESWFVDKVRSYRGNPYGHLINLAKIAQKSGVIKGILLHQGEANAGDKNWPKYVKSVYRNILKDLSLDAKSVPLIAGEVVHEDQKGMFGYMNQIINTLPQVIPTAHVVSSKGCLVQEDNLHFNSEGVRKLGKRYADKILEIQQK
ncbi:acetylxylan esterase [Ochrovirga pacifica]|uniref:acetylxylan esterase n=1 Tax=Ochrovirga pacifica TaxID=1042376 RepID=UPI00025583E5|nr:acetylxylan esterase [Ochrovirga pacifica]